MIRGGQSGGMGPPTDVATSLLRLAMNMYETQERLRNDPSMPEIERAARANSVRNAIAITPMEGGQPSAFCLELLALYETGEISGAV
jgi:hypothetical protein